MLAHHPVTGKEIREIKTDASMWKEHKTLAVGASQMYDTVASEGTPTYFVQITPASKKEILDASRSSKLLFISQDAIAGTALIGGIGVKEFRELQLQNVISLEEINKLYPHIGGAWDGTFEDAVIMIAGLMRYRKIAGLPMSPMSPMLARAQGLGLTEATSTPYRIWWLTQYYVPEKPKRRKEIRTCLERNMESKLIDRIVLMNEKKEELPTGGQVPIEERVLGKRLTYADVIHAAAEFPADVICVFANADICIDDESWRQLWQVNMENKFLALLRYDVPESGRTEDAKIFGPRADSQDTWVVRVEDILKRGASTIAKGLDFPFGKMGCDNTVALEMLRQKFLVVNPCLSLKTWHFHSSGVRGYETNDVIDRPIFHYVHPSGFHDLQPMFTFEKVANANIQEPIVLGVTNPVSLIRQVRGGASTKWLMAANKRAETPMKLEDANLITPGREFVVGAKNVFSTANGLAYTKDRLLIGAAPRAQNVWSTATMSALTPTLECKKGLITPWPKGAEKSRVIYLLRYLSKILRLVPEGASRLVEDGWEFFCPEERLVTEALESFTWNAAKLPVIKYEDDMALWCEDARILPVSECEAVLAEDIAALRGSLRGWKKSVNTERLRIVIVEDDKVLDDSLVRELEEVLEGSFDVKVVYPERSSAHRITDCFSGAWGVICCSGLEACGWNWILPEGEGVVLEVSIDGDTAGLEVSAAAGLKHRFVERSKDAILKEVWREEESWKLAKGTAGTGCTGTGCTGGETLPIVWMPRADLEGYFAHPGDSFREMVRLWGKAGLCRVREHPTATMVWWGEVGRGEVGRGEVGRGGVLLYDRPNHDWRLAAPTVEKEWKMALFGNPKVPSGRADSSPWFFWPRRPALVEEIVEQGSFSSWEKRTGSLVFYGKTENKVQEKRRSTADWSSACSEWSMVNGTEPYPFTHSEYLLKLADSRFGLCLAGYGYKCHREIECMAMGCVPICAPEVDMNSYAVPPLEGVHYLRVNSPEEAREKVASVSKEAWEVMSAAGRAWWKENCSVQGSFALTQKLVSQ